MASLVVPSSLLPSSVSPLVVHMEIEGKEGKQAQEDCDCVSCSLCQDAHRKFVSGTHCPHCEDHPQHGLKTPKEIIAEEKAKAQTKPSTSPSKKRKRSVAPGMRAQKLSKQQLIAEGLLEETAPKKRPRKEKVTVVLVEEGKGVPNTWKTTCIEKYCYYLTPQGKLEQHDPFRADSEEVPFPREITVHPKYLELAEELKKLVAEGHTCHVRKARFSGKPHMNNLLFHFGRTVEEDEKYLPVWLAEQEEERKQRELQDQRSALRKNFKGMPWGKVFDDKIIQAYNATMEFTNLQYTNLTDLEASIVSLMSADERAHLDRLKRFALFSALSDATHRW